MTHEPADGGDVGARWEARYAQRSAHGQVWRGEPNATLVAEVASLEPGRALDPGCGEGADAVWLAVRGWRVTAVDVAPTALERGAHAAAERGVAARVGWLQRDLSTWEPAPGSFDLVAAHFVHAPAPERAALLARWETALAPGGTLLVVAHSPQDLGTGLRRPPDPELYATAQEMATSLSGEVEVVTAQERPRVVEGPDGRPVTAHDAVLRAVRPR